MKALVKRDDLSNVLQEIQSVVEKKSTMPILSNVLLEASRDRLHITATDLEISIRDSIGAQVPEEGSTTVEARKIYEISRSLPDEDITLSAEKGRLEVQGKRSFFTLVTLPEEDYPKVPSYPEEETIPMDASSFKDILDKTAFAASIDESRYTLRGIFLENDEGRLNIVATDGHRLSLVCREDPGLNLEKGVIIPRKGVNELRKLLPKGDSLRISIKEKDAIFLTGTATLITRLVDGDFPDYKQVLPKGEGNPFTTDREAFLSALKRVSIMAGGSIGVKLRIGNGVMTLFASNPDLGEAREDLEIRYSGEEVEAIFNPKYLIEPLSILDSEEVRFSIKDPLSPAILTTPDDEGFLYIVMPMRE